ncbi:MAG TPA: acyl-ACP desaturase [Acidimicrobiales bacterium]|nr:acyl-ACP desaturase [Acidimicrobiales bacterium]
MDASTLVAELEPTVETLLARHLTNAKEWFPHELVPWSRGRDFEVGEPWDPDEAPMPDAVRSALIVDLLTEDNLPYYFETIFHMFSNDGAWGEWARRWTAEEGRHSIVIRDYLSVTRAVDLIDLERGRMSQMSTGEVPRPGSPMDGLVYVTLQELATRISHRNTGRLLEDRTGYEIMARVAGDENLHHVFYRDAASAALELDPSEAVLAMERQVCGFAMPGTGIPEFNRHSKAIAQAGIYDFTIHHDQILEPIVLEHWNLAGVEGLSAEAEVARERTIKYIGRVKKAGERMSARRDRAQERESVSV